MTPDPASILRQAESAGIRLELSDSGAVKAFGERENLSRWTPILRERKHEIRRLLEGYRTKGRQRFQRPPRPQDGKGMAAFGGARSPERSDGAAALFVGEGAAGDIRVWISAGRADAELPRCIAEPRELQAVVEISDPEIVAEILSFKKRFPDGPLHSGGQ